MSEQINFFKGFPTENLLPNKQIVEATSELLLNDREYDLDPSNKHPLSYGSDPGALWVRDEITRFSNRVFKPNAQTQSDYINLTGGASYGIMNILQQCTFSHTNYTKQVFIVTPTYFLVNETFIDAGFGGKMTGINEVNNSIDFNQLEANLNYYSKIDQDKDFTDDLKLINKPSGNGKKIYKFIFYCIPTFSNPGGETYDLKTRLRLIELARKFDMLIITDDVYDLLDYTQPLDQLPHPLPRLTHLDRETCTNEFGNTVINSTFSKLIAPGLRCGYQESVNENLVRQLSTGGANSSGGSPSQLNSMIVGTMLKNNSIELIINYYRSTFASRSKLLKTLIEKHLPKGTVATGFDGGYFIWVKLPEIYDSFKISQELKSRNVIIANGDNFEVIGDYKNWGKSCVRLSLSYVNEHDMQVGIEEWGKVIDSLYSRNKLLHSL